MGSHDFEVDLEALGTAVSELSDLQERNRTYDVADYTPNSGMVGDPVVAGALERWRALIRSGIRDSMGCSETFLRPPDD